MLRTLAIAAAAHAAAAGAVAPSPVPGVPDASTSLWNGSYRCCAMGGDGTYAANTSTIGSAWGASFFHAPGYAAADVARQRYVSIIGGGDVDTSIAGFLGAGCGTKSIAITWSPHGCNVMVLPAGVPRFCYGHDTYEPQIASLSRIDIFTHQLHFRSISGHRTTAVNPFTCMPFHSTMLTGGCEEASEYDSEEVRAAADSELATPSSGSGEIVTMYANASAPWLPTPAPIFSFPNWCTFAGEEYDAERALLAECGI